MAGIAVVGAAFRALGASDDAEGIYCITFGEDGAKFYRKGGSTGKDFLNRQKQYLVESKEAVIKAKSDVDEGGSLYDSQVQEHAIEFDQIKLGKVLGEGAEGIVQLGQYQNLDVAIKITEVSLTSLNFSPVAKQLAEAQEEAKILLPLHHPNVVMVYGVSVDFGEYDVRALTVMDTQMRARTHSAVETVS